jgi:hypothetical protein
VVAEEIRPRDDRGALLVAENGSQPLSVASGFEEEAAVGVAARRLREIDPRSEGAPQCCGRWPPVAAHCHTETLALRARALAKHPRHALRPDA